MTDNLNQTEQSIIVHAPNKYSLGITFGIITGLVYVVLLFIRYNFFAYSPVVYSTFAFIAYILILGMYLLCGIRRKKQLGEYSETKDIFLTLFITILITEITYVIFNFIYLTYIDPDFMNRYLQVTYDYLSHKGISTQGVEAQMDKLKEQTHSLSSVAFSFVGLGIWIIIDSIVCLMLSLALRKPKPQF
jgi:hypothetical protein